MKTYKLTLKQKSGLLTELQSDTIYGHFCWRLKERLGDEKLSEFIALYKNYKPVFTLSDGLLQADDEIQFPRPLVFSKPEIKQTKTEKVMEFVKRKSDKEQNFIKLNELNKFLNSGTLEFEEKPNIKNEVKAKIKKPLKSESLRVSVQIDRSSFGSSEGRLFSYKPEYTREDISYVLLIKVIDEPAFKNFLCEKIIRDIFTTGFGKKKSSGYGQFEVGNMIEFNEIKEPQEFDAFMVLGNYLPAESDRGLPIGYETNTKYGKLGEEFSQSENPFKNPIVFLEAGSCFKTENKKYFYGRVTDEGEISPANRFAVQFGMPFTLNFKSM